MQARLAPILPALRGAAKPHFCKLTSAIVVAMTLAAGAAIAQNHPQRQGEVIAGSEDAQIIERDPYAYVVSVCKRHAADLTARAFHQQGQQVGTPDFGRYTSQVTQKDAVLNGSCMDVNIATGAVQAQRRNSADALVMLALEQEMNVRVFPTTFIASILEGGRASQVESIFFLDNLGLSAEQLSRAKSLRAQIDTADFQRGTLIADPTDRRYWHLRAEFLSIVSATTAQHRLTTSPVHSSVTIELIDAARGVFVARDNLGIPSITVTPGGWLEAMHPANTANATDAVRAYDGVDAARGNSAWDTQYSAGDVVGAIDGFRQDFEAVWPQAIAAAAAQAGVSKGQKLVLIADGESAMLPIVTLRDPASGRALLEDYEIVFTPSHSVYNRLLALNPTPSRPSIAFVAPPAQESALTFVETEVTSIRGVLGGDVSEIRAGSGKAAAMLQLSSATYWHFATHGAFDVSSPRMSWLQVPGGERLTLSDLLHAPQPIGAPRLVVLSACETGVLDTSQNPDDFVGLPAGFLAAGALGVVASLWPVDDVSTSLLMAKFYDEHLRLGRAPSAALREAQLWLKNSSATELKAFASEAARRGNTSPTLVRALINAIDSRKQPQPFSHPYYWGAFVYYGV